ncbi:unnamed protein product [Choristocarpus tenellus]
MGGQYGRKRGNHLRVFAHYVLGRLAFLFFVCHPGTLATFSDSQTYLKNRYPNRDLVTTEGQVEQRRHITPRSSEDFAMRTGVPDSVLNGDMTSWVPDWAPSLETRFHNRVKAWLMGYRSSPDHISQLPGLAFISPASTVRTIHACACTASDRQSHRWNTLSHLEAIPKAARGQHHPAFVYSSGRQSSALHMLLGLDSVGARFRGRQASSKMSGSGLTGSAATQLPVVTDGTPAQEPDPASSIYSQLQQQGSISSSSTSLGGNLFSSLMGSAADMYDMTMNYVGCAIVTSSFGKRYLNSVEDETYKTVPASAIRSGAVMGADPYDLVGFSNIDPFEASRRRSSGNSGMRM